ncbi:MAG: glycosyltransferase family 1 protein [Lentisphaerota bacterium]
MKACIDAREFKPGRATGIGRYLETLVSGLKRRRAFEIILLADTPEAVPEFLGDLQVIPLRMRLAQLQDQVEIPRLVQAHGAGLLISPYYKTALWGRFNRTTTVHDILFLRRRDETASKRLWVRAYLSLCCRKADAILADSEFTRQDLVRYLPFTRSKTHLIYPGLDNFWFAPADRQKGRDAGASFTDGKPFILYVGNFKPHKNVDVLVDGFLAYRAAHPKDDLCLLLIGGERSIIQSKIAGHESRVRVLSGVNNETLKLLYAGAQWVITASAYEGFGYPLVEAMACGCPIISSNTTSLREIAGEVCVAMNSLTSDGVSDSLAKAQALLPDDRESLIFKGKERAKVFTSDRMIDHYMALPGISAVGSP